jgi:hypothetical protein
LYLYVSARVTGQFFLKQTYSEEKVDKDLRMCPRHYMVIEISIIHLRLQIGASPTGPADLEAGLGSIEDKLPFGEDEVFSGALRRQVNDN